MLEPFFFGSKTCSLFGIYSPPQSADRDAVVVFCPPLFDEYRCTYRAFSELSRAFSANGFHVLRFDYRGTEESWGELREVTVGDWIEDIHVSIEEALVVSGASRVVLLGTRFGATLASHCRHHSICSYLYWDPILSGRQYLDIIESNNALIKVDGTQLRWATIMGQKDTDYSNFQLSSAMRESFCSLDFQPNTDIDESVKVHTIDTLEQTLPSTLNSRHINYSCDWSDYGRYYGQLMTPKPILSALLQSQESL